MKLFVMRHGETDWNRNNRVLGLTDIPLNSSGVEQAKEAAKKLSAVPIKAIYTSCFTRTIDTARIISKFQTNNCKVIPTKALNEQNFGVFEGVERSDDSYQKAKREFFKRYPQGESYFDLAFRVYSFLEDLKSQGDDSALIVTHGGVCRIIANRYADMDNDEFVAFAMKNCEIREYNI